MSALQNNQELETLPNDAFEDLVMLVAQICETPLAAVTLVDGKRQWIKSTLGLEVGETERSHEFCDHVMRTMETLHVTDARLDARFSESDLVQHEPKICFYAGVPLILENGRAVGTFAVMDTMPRHLNAVQLKSLQVMADQVSKQLDLRAMQRKQEPILRLSMTLQHMTDAFCILDSNWQMTYLNPVAERLILHSADEMQNVRLWDRFPPTASSALYTEFHRAVEEHVPVHFEIFYPPLHNWFEVHAYPVPDGLAVFFRVITERIQALEALRTSEERFRQLAESIDDVFWLWDPNEDRILYASPRYETIFGQSREELYKNPRSFARDIHPDDVERLRAAAAVDRSDIKIDYRLLLADGQIRWVGVRTFPVRDETGHVRHSVGIARDITQLMEATALLRASEQQYRLLFAHNPHPMWVYDAETLRFLAVNEQAISHYGYSQEEFLAMTIKDIRPTEDMPRFENMHSQWITRKSSGSWRHCKKDGTIIDVEISSDAIVFDGQQARLVLANDVTARRQAEDQVRQQAALLDKAQDAISVCDLNHRFTYWNHGAERLYGWKAEEVIGRHTQELLYREPASYHQAYQELLLNGEWFGELHSVDRSGRDLLVEVRWTLVRDEDGEAQAVLAINTNIVR